MAAFQTANDFFYINGILDCNKAQSGTVYDRKFSFLSSVGQTISPDDLITPASDQWEIALTQVDYVKQSSTIQIPFPHPEVTTAAVYEMYDVEILYGPLMMFPLHYYDTKNIEQNMKDEFQHMFNVDITNKANTAYIKDNYARNLQMYIDLAAKSIQQSKKLQKSTMTKMKKKYYVILSTSSSHH